MAKPIGRPRKSPTFNKPTREFRQEAAYIREPEPNFDLLTDEDKATIRAKAAAKVEAAERDRAMEAFLAEEVARIEKSLHPEAHEEEKEIEIDVAIYTDRIVLDGHSYLHGRKYTVKKSIHDALRDVMWKTQLHYNATHRDPARAAMEAQQAIAKGGQSYAVINGSNGQVTRF